MNTKTLLVLVFAGLFAVTANAALTGVTINGEPLNDAVGSSGAGWNYTPPTLTLSGAGPFMISGTNTAGKVRVVVQAGGTKEVTLSNLTLKAMGDNLCAFALGTGANVSLSLAGENTLDSGYGRAGLEVPAGASLSITNVPGDDAGALTATGGDYGAGIGGGDEGNGGTVAINGGTVSVTGGECAAGIGGGENGNGGTVAISGGTVTATGTWGGAGIGGGDYGTGGTVAISGGIVFAQGEYGAGIGGGYNGDGGTVNISGGTVFAQGNQGGQDIGKGVDGTDAGPNTFTGGSIRLTAGDVSLQPSNNTAQVGCAMVPGFDPGAPVAFTDPGNLPLYYGTDDIYADEGGAIHLWLPDGTYTFTANGRECTVTIQDGVGATGVTVNGEEAAFGPADPSAGWGFDAATRTVWLFGAGPFTLSGVNEMGGVSFAVPDNIANTVTLSNLTIRVPADDQCAFALGQNANVSLLLAGANALSSGFGRAGIEVPAGRTLSITNAPGDDAGSLTVTGGEYGAGIGGGNEGHGGTLTISGGTVAATGGDGAAGIGGGDYGNGGTVTINGGTVTATGGQYGTGIGGGDYGNGGTVTINGGSVTAIGDSHSAGIGGGDEHHGGTVTINGGSVTATSDNYGAGIGGGNTGNGGAVTINGGTVFAQGGAGGADIGPGRNSVNAGANTFTGGSIWLAAGDVSLQPSNNTEQVFCAVVPGFDPGEWVEFTDTGTLPAGFGTDDIFADDGGVIYLWLPNGEYTFTANGRECTVTIQDGIGPTGVTVNGVEVAFGGPPGAGWVYDGNARTLTLSGAGPFLLSGINTIGGVCVVVPEGVTNTVTLSNLKLRATGDGQCAFALETDANVSLLLAGANELASGSGRAGLEAAEERTLSITNAPGDDAGSLTVTGGRGAAGIGGGYNGNGGTVTVNGGAVTATGGYAGAGIGGGYNYSNIPNADTDSGGTVTVNGGAVTATGGDYAAGIGGGAFGGGGTVTINSGAVTAMGGFDGAGIGGGYERQGATATITGGEIFATGGDYAPGIGGGFIYNSTNSTAGWGGTVAISGGRVMATGGWYAAGIGGGSGWTGEGGDGADLTVSGGTVFATGGADGGPGVGSGVGNSKNGGIPPHVSGTCTFTGGSIRILGGYAADDPTDDSERVWCVTVTNLTPNAEIVVTSLPVTYGVNDLFADEAGQLYFWLPNASYDFTAGGADYEATVDNADTTATQKAAPPAPVSVGVTVNGIALDEAGSNGEGWTYVLPTLSLTNAGPFTISGTNTAGAVRVVVQEGVTNEVTLSNLTLVATNKNQCAFALETNAVVSLFLAGTNELASGWNRAGLEVAAGRTLSITNAPGDEAGALTATGGDEGAGIGGGSGGAGGAVTISGGTVTANGSEFFGAGIGGGAGGAGGTATLSGGTVTANGGVMGAGIGSGGYSGGSGGTVNISGGAVTANGGDWSAGIGGGDGDAGGTTTISGGEVTATGGKYGAGIGGGNNGENPDGIAGSGGTVNISGGRVTATGGKCAAGIGGGTGQGLDGSAGAALSVSGGTLFATGGAGGAPGIGPGLGNVGEGETGDLPDPSGTSTFTGGSIRIDGVYAAAAPSNNTARVWCVTVPDLTANAHIAVTSLPVTYGVNDLFADNNGKLYFWLPNDSYDFTAGGADYEATVNNADTTATQKSAPPAPSAYLTFSSASAFTVKPTEETWDGTLQYSTNATDWDTFTTAGANAANNGSGTYTLYLRGTNNTYITGAYNAPAWTITAEGTVACSGNIETLLDYTTVLAEEHPPMADWCFANLFRYCTALSGAPELPATTLAYSCYRAMFHGCVGLTEAPELPATTLASSCYYFMFSGCTALASAPELPAETLAYACYQYMFDECANMTNAPALPATTLVPSCYYGMFFGCAGLTQAPALPATNLADSCYASLFKGCSGLTQAPPLPVETLADGCYSSMFSGCTSLAEAPVLPATNLTPYCYTSMFWGCTSLTNLPALPAKKLAYSCYASMFRDCTGIKLYTTGSGPAWGIPEGATPSTDWNKTMLEGTGGGFTGDPVPGTVYYYDPTIPPPSTAYLTFSSADTFTITPSAVSWNGALFYSTNTTDWIAFDRDGATAALDSGSGEYRLYFRGTGNTLITGGNLAYWEINAAPATVDCSGNIETLLDYATVDGGGHPAMIANCFANLFKDCTALGSAPELPATNLVNNCYVGMFRNCTGLTNAPALPATTLPGGCYQEMFRDCTSLAQAPALPAMTLSPSCYKGMFTNCTALATAPELPATTLGVTCYQYMFAGCTGLTNAPALQATTLVTGCYHSMFFGCTGLTQLPVLPATNLVPFCYAFMFKDCTGVALHAEGTAPTWGIPNDAVEANGWNTNMLANTGGTFTGDPAIGTLYYYTPSTPPVSTAYLTFASTNAFKITPQVQYWEGVVEYSTDAAEWHEFTTTGADAAPGVFGDYRLYVRGTNNTCVGSSMFGWNLNATAPVVCSGNIETLLDYPTVEGGDHPAMGADCFGNLFRNWTWLVNAPALPAVTLANGCYQSMFEGCTRLESAPALPAATLAKECYRDMFNGCTGLTDVPGLPAGTLADYACNSMFKGCTSLATAPALAATNLANYCCQSMFEGCTSLTNAPALPAGTLATSCYASMFKDCTSLAEAPELSATNLANYCCYQMFAGCTGLTNAPALPAGTLANQCYYKMFSGCTSLAQTPELSAMNLASHCYANMFEGCTALTRLPELPATTLATACYKAMFKGCTGITLYADGTAPIWGIPADAQDESAIAWNQDMLAGTGGGFTGDPVIGAIYYYTPSTPPVSIAYLTFSSTNTFTITPQAESWNGTLETSADATNWVAFTTVGATAAANANGEYKLHIRGTGNSRISANYYTPAWTINAAVGTVACSGNIETLLDYQTVDNGEHPAMTDYCFANLFRDCTALISAPGLPATSLAVSCYESMFSGCTGLTNAPELPATNLAVTCYYAMFSGCTNLTQAPVLPATTLAEGCYSGIFSGCTSLTNAPTLPATTLAGSCYQSMFSGCTGLTGAPTLPAETLADYCYYSMFVGCTGLTSLPALPATTLASFCYAGMFSGCTGITLHEVGAGPTWGIPAGVQEALGWNSGMLTGTGGSFTDNPVIGATYYYTASTPPLSDAYLTFSSTNAFSITPREKYWNGTLETSTDTTNWVDFTTAGATAAANGNGEFRLYIRGTGNNRITGSYLREGWIVNAPTGTVACSGNIGALLDYATVDGGGYPAMDTACFANLFRGCSALVNAPDLPATTLTPNCYYAMFYRTSLTNTPALPATNLADYCYSSLFEGCTGLTQTPVLPATTLAPNCYNHLFAHCVALTNAPALPAMKMAEWCYYSMFEGCTGLTRLPDLPATQLAPYCYQQMFRDCTGITLHTEGSGPAWGIPGNATSAHNWNFDMLAGTGGTFTNNPAIGATYYYTASAPTPRTYVTFTSASAFSIKPQVESWDGTLEYSTDTTNWVAFTTNNAAIAVTDGNGTYTLHFSGTGNTRISPNDMGVSGWTLVADGTVACSGNIGSLLDYATVAGGGQPAVTNYCFANLFSGWTALTSAPNLPATTLARGCYYGMFRNCTGLTQTPDLPATNLARTCYASMFQGCTGLTNLPTLAATALADNCYASMFKNCSGIMLHADGTAPTWSIPADAVEATGWNQDMLAGTGGTFTGDPQIGVTYYYTLPQVGVQVVFDATGGAFADGPSAVTQVCVNVYGDLPVATREGYTLVGWFDGCTNGAAQAAAGGALLYNTAHTLHARWTAKPGTTPASIFAYTNNADGTITITGFTNPNQQVTKLVLPDMIDGRFVTAIAPGAFANSTSGMTEVHIPVFCTSIGDKAFTRIPTITRLVFPNTRDWRNPTQPAALHIGKYAFSAATGLTELTLPVEVASLDDYAFFNTRNLQKITILGRPALGTQVFRNAGVDTEGVTLHIDPVLAADEEYMARLTALMHNVTVRTDGTITGLRIYKIGFAPSGNVILGVIVERYPEWGEFDPASIWVEYRARLGDDGEVWFPDPAELEEDGTVTLEVDRPEGGSAFFRAFVAPEAAD